MLHNKLGSTHYFVIILLLTIFSVALALSGAGGLIGSGAALLVLILPGSALTIALFPDKFPGDLEYALLSIGLSLTIAVIGGLLLTLIPSGLTTLNWTILLGGITFLALLIAFMRRSAPTLRFKIGLNMRQALKMIAALVITAAAFEIASSGALQQRAGATFTQLWMLPAEAALSMPSRTLQIGIFNQEATPMIYHLRLEANGVLITEWAAIPVNVGERWQTTVHLSAALPTGSQMRALLYRQNETIPYRVVTFWPESGN